MPKSTDTLSVATRSRTGTPASNALRREGKIPGILYGHGAEAKAVALEAKAFEELLHAGGRNRLLTLTIDGTTQDTALVRDVQRDPISRRVVHADLQRVGATEEISASLPLVTTGVAEGVRSFGGVMDVIVRSIEVTGPANAQPEQIEVDVSALGLYGHVTAGELKLPSGITLGIDPATVVISIEPARVEQEAVEAAEPAVSPAETPTVGESTEPQA